MDEPICGPACLAACVIASGALRHSPGGFTRYSAVYELPLRAPWNELGRALYSFGLLSTLSDMTTNHLPRYQLSWRLVVLVLVGSTQGCTSASEDAKLLIGEMEIALVSETPLPDAASRVVFQVKHTSESELELRELVLEAPDEEAAIIATDDQAVQPFSLSARCERDAIAERCNYTLANQEGFAPGSYALTVDASTSSSERREVLEFSVAESGELSAVCGDGVREGQELCDDGNAENGDGCNATCGVETAWQWVDLPGTRCMNGGTQTGIAVRRSAGAQRTLVYFQQGGACFAPTCLVSSTVLHDRFGTSEFNKWKADEGTSGIFNLSNVNNPFSTYNQVFVPYCSGDVFSGDNRLSAGRQHHGYINVGIALEWISARFKQPEQLALVGSSAGGYGASYNADRFYQAFPESDIVVISDSAPVFDGREEVEQVQYPTNEADTSTALGEALPSSLICNDLLVHWSEIWNHSMTVPERCSRCAPDFVNIYGFLAREHRARYGLISSDNDWVISLMFSAGYNALRRQSHTCGTLGLWVNATWSMPRSDFRRGLRELREHFKALNETYGSRFYTYYIPNTDRHVWLVKDTLIDPAVSRWLGNLLENNGDVVHEGELD